MYSFDYSFNYVGRVTEFRQPWLATN